MATDKTSFLTRCSKAELEQIDRAAKEQAISRNRYVLQAALNEVGAKERTPLTTSFADWSEKAPTAKELYDADEFPHG